MPWYLYASEPHFPIHLHHIIVTNIGILGGVAGCVAALTHGTNTARACMFGWIAMAIYHITVQIDLHRPWAHTLGLAAIHGLFVVTLAEYLPLCQWYKTRYAVGQISDAYQPLLLADELESTPTTASTETTVSPLKGAVYALFVLGSNTTGKQSKTVLLDL